MNIKTPFKLYWVHEGTTYEAYSYDDNTYGINSSRGNLHLYGKSDIHDLITGGVVVVLAEDPLVTIKQSEYDDLIEEINMLQELVKELSAPQDDECGNTFKPIGEYTLEDWQQAIDEDWKFKCRDGYPVQVVEVNRTFKYPVECTDGLCRDIKGFWCSDKVDEDDIVKRIR